MLTLMRIAWTNLTRDRVAQALTFLLPIIFFSIFATVFGDQGDAQTTRIRVAVVDEDQSELSRRLIEGLKKESGLRVRTTADEDAAGPALDRAAAERLVRGGDVPVAVVIPRGLGEAFGQSGFGGGPAIALLADPSDPIAPQMVGGLLQKVTMTAAPDLMMQGGIRQFETYAGAAHAAAAGGGGRVDSEAQVRRRVGHVTAAGRRRDGRERAGRRRHAHGDKQRGSLISFYAAGIGVMFLLFSMVGAAGGVLLDEAESGTLERLLSTRLGMSGILFGKWVFLVAVGFAQLTVMFLWGDLAFGLPLFSHLGGFVVMTLATAAAAAGAGARPRHARALPRPALGLLDDPHPDDVGARRQHVPALPDERDDAARRPRDVQRLGARRLPEGVLARCAHLAVVAAARGPLGARDRVPRRRAGPGAPMGGGVGER